MGNYRLLLGLPQSTPSHCPNKQILLQFQWENIFKNHYIYTNESLSENVLHVYLLMQAGMCPQFSAMAKRSAPSTGSPSPMEPLCRPTPRANWCDRLPPTNLSSTCPCTFYRGMSHFPHCVGTRETDLQDELVLHVLACQCPAAQADGFVYSVRDGTMCNFMLASGLDVRGDCHNKIRLEG